MGVLFAVGSACFLVAPVPAFLDLVGPEAVGVVFFVGSLLFTAAASLQLRGSVRAGGGSWWQPKDPGWWSSVVQLAGTLFFNITTLRGMTYAIDSPSYDRLVWRPDAFGSVCFLVSGCLAYAQVAGSFRRRPPRGTDGAIASVNLFGCVAFGVAAVGAYVLPSSQHELDMAIANLTTSLGGLAFLVGAMLLLRQHYDAAPATVPRQ